MLAKTIKAKSSDELELLSINLQMFADGEESDSEANDGQSGVVDSTGDDSDVGTDTYLDFNGTDDEEEEIKPYKKPKEYKAPPEEDSLQEEDFDEGSNDEEFAEPQSKMTPEENKAYQKIRQKAEAEARAMFEKEKALLDEQRKSIQEQINVMQQKEIEQRHLQEITDEKIDSLAYEKGYSYEAAKEILTRDARDAARNEMLQRQQQTEINRLKKEQLKKERYYSAIEPQLDALLQQDPNVDINGAYTYLLGEYVKAGKLDDFISQEKKYTQQKTLADVQDRSRRRSLGTDAGTSTRLNPNTYLTKEDLKIANAWGNDPRELAKYRREQELNSKKRR